MKWRPIGAHTYESDTGHTIMRATANGVPTGRFIAFRGKSVTRVDDKGRTVLEKIPTVLGAGANGTLDEAIELCKRDATRNYEVDPYKNPLPDLQPDPKAAA